MTVDSTLRKPDLSEARIQRRYAAERRFKMFGQLAVATAIGMLALMLFTIVKNGWTAFYQTQIAIDVAFDATSLDPTGARDPETLRAADWQGLVKNALKAQFPEVTERADRKKLYSLVSSGAGETLMDMVLADPSLIGQTVRVMLPANDDIDMLKKGSSRAMSRRPIAWSTTSRSPGSTGSRPTAR